MIKKILLILLIFLFSCKSSPEDFNINRTHGLPTLIVTINGVKVEMIMDTGGAITVIDDDYLKRLRINKFNADKEIVGYGGSKTVDMTGQREINMGDKVMYGDIFVTDLDYLVKGSGIVGILGIEHLSSAQANINLETNTITLK